MPRAPAPQNVPQRAPPPTHPGAVARAAPPSQPPRPPPRGVGDGGARHAPAGQHPRRLRGGEAVDHVHLQSGRQERGAERARGPAGGEAAAVTLTSGHLSTLRVTPIPCRMSLLLL